jgi:CBS-domain-containing membrane protein
MMRERKIRDVILPLSDCPHMPYWGPLKEAIVQLNVAHETGHQAVLVFDEAYALVGILSQMDILKALDHKKGFPVSWDRLLGEETEKQLSRPVEDFMSKVKVTVDVSDSMLEASQIMLQESARLLPVMEGSRVIGVLRMDNLFHQITNAILKL